MGNKLVNELFKYKNYKYRLIVKNLFSLNINETQVIFVSCDGLKDAKESFINSNLYKALGVVYVNKIKNWDLIKGHSKRANVIFLDSENQDTKSKHVGFGF